MTLTLDDLYASPDHYLHSFDGDDAIFVPMDRAAYHRSIFLDARISTAAEGSMRLPLSALPNEAPRGLPTAWIMHVAHCGSTLLARALDAVEGSLVLREPQALRQTAFAPDDPRLAATVALLSKRYRPDAPTLIKGNVPINFLIPRIAGLDSTARMIFLYLPLRDYLLAILRDEDHRAWLRRVTAQLAPYLATLPHASDAECAAALWLAQIEIYASAGSTMRHARSLDAETFFAHPRATLIAAATHLGMPMSEATIDGVIAGPLFATYSKNPAVAFDNAARLARKNAVEGGLSPEIAAAETWLTSHRQRAGAALAALAAMKLQADTA